MQKMYRELENAAPDFAEKKRKEILNKEVSTEIGAYTKTIMIESLELAQKEDADAEIVGYYYLSHFMKVEVCF